MMMLEPEASTSFQTDSVCAQCRFSLEIPRTDDYGLSNSLETAEDAEERHG